MFYKLCFLIFGTGDLTIMLVYMAQCNSVKITVDFIVGIAHTTLRQAQVHYDSVIILMAMKV